MTRRDEKLQCESCAYSWIHYLLSAKNFRTIQPKCLDTDEDLPDGRDRLRPLLELENFGSTRLMDDNSCRRRNFWDAKFQRKNLITWWTGGFGKGHTEYWNANRSSQVHGNHMIPALTKSVVLNFLGTTWTPVERKAGTHFQLSQVRVTYVPNHGGARDIIEIPRYWVDFECRSTREYS